MERVKKNLLMKLFGWQKMENNTAIIAMTMFFIPNTMGLLERRQTMSKEYDTNKAWGDAPRGYHQSQAEYWRSMCKSLREVLAEKDIYIEQLQKRLEVEEKKKSIQYSDEFIEAFGNPDEKKIT